MSLISQIPSPCYVLYEERLRKNLELIKRVKDKAGVEIIMAFKAFALWKSFPIVKEYIKCSTASSLNEALLAVEEMGSKAHTFAPVYTDAEFDYIAACSSHITFNSISQYEKYRKRTRGISCGLRVNPEYSVVETDIYNPCVAGSRLGIKKEELAGGLPDGIEGLHVHCLCESSAADTAGLLLRVEELYGEFLDKVKWLNLGGGHLMTRKDYDVELLVTSLVEFRKRHPNLQVILEPGSAFAWRAGDLVSTVQDIVERDGIKTAMLDVSFACHMPDCLEMPYKPAIEGATDPVAGKPTYRMGGNSCLSGDYVGEWSFDEPLKVGDRVVFEDMAHYTTVKTTMFNGVTHPSMVLVYSNGQMDLLRKFTYQDYKKRMS
ncbi:MAG: carboxynorspermidine decarboxylase [Paludibacteraceae bacterium]|nr:carboxynorspermidine decarboxylase [Paludibacteraceae bacterium]MBQ3929489.1 carboxynorspermidine decarboxylase [Paludibacteraceae bacterium]MBQ6731557.1 carboxynorspermidine decarboxylase [Paludibacteraceae bacterium]